MSSLELTSAINAVANTIACKLSPEEITLLAAVLVQLGDTLVTIATLQQNCTEKNTRCFEN